MQQTETLEAALPKDTPSAHGPRRWVPIRVLGPQHAPRVAAHLLALADDDRMRRFGVLASDERIRNYAEHIAYKRDEVFGVFDRRLKLVAMAHLAFESAGAKAGGSAEFGVSVSAHIRGRGMGSRLFDHAVTHARNRGVSTMVIHMARDNAAMLGIVRSAGADLSFDGGDAMAHLPLPADTLGSQIEELLGHQAAELDYRFKLQVLRLDAMRPGTN
jgi:ribosomal protein S18 acetylase RimI-like enzyme